jgi:LuxR family maltose regulon positive regulatory protein
VLRHAAFAAAPRADLREIAADLGLSAQIEDLLARAPVVFPDRINLIALTPRERVILNYLATDASLGAIAQSEFVSVNTVKTQYRTLYRKLGATRREDAIRIARAAGFLS